MMKEIDKYNVRIIQKDKEICDQIYDIYNPLTVMVIDEREGAFYHKDYNEVCKMPHEERGSVFPCRNYSIVSRDYFSVSVSLRLYLKMLSGKIPFPFGLDNTEERIKYDLINATPFELPKEVEETIMSYKKLLT